MAQNFFIRICENANSVIYNDLKSYQCKIGFILDVYIPYLKDFISCRYLVNIFKAKSYNSKY